MINKLAKYLLALCAVAATASCDSFLDRQEDETMTFDKIWQQFGETRKYFFQAMSFLPNDASIFYGGDTGSAEYNMGYYCIGASDESTCTWNWGYRSMTSGAWNPTSLPSNSFDHYYGGILECNIFLANVMSCSDPAAEKSDLNLWYNCVRWARAYYYFLLMRDYGPVFLVGDEQMDFTASASSLARPRNTWEECVKYVVDEMEWCAQRLPDKHASSTMGLPTKGAALAVISRLKLYSARDLFNGNNLYRMVRNADGTNLFPQEKDPQKWVEAAQAAKAVIDLADDGLYTLYRIEEPTGNATQDAVLNYLGITQEEWNSELIFCSGGFRSRNWMAAHVTPAVATGGSPWAGWGPTQQQVDAYAMANGRYPIEGYEADGQPIIDEASGYNADEFGVATQKNNPMMQALCESDIDLQKYYKVDTRNMYVDREPRFYVSVFFAGSYWMHDKETLSDNDMVSFCQGGNGHVTHDYPRSGYLVNRFYDHTINSFTSGNGSITFPSIRLGEIYLNYIEAVLECERNGVSGEGVDHSLAMQKWDDLRDRSGMPPIEEVYPGSSVEELIELVRKERRVELAFEGHRYYDTRTWMIATKTDHGPMYGMDPTVVTGEKTETSEEFWKRKVFENRVFRENHYLFPIPQDEINRNRLIVQNYGW